ncbi:hypothetical protein EGW08_004478 [Elysia chlorotica]|uniref:Uncharacterized protein n=1 Tax=Elysia chlorotica TaxID=188477 RepID=A0A433U1P0_ELYCH|nr:hypothetical protein EGW08_004478 [Elysia chlorotica]
MFWLCMNNSTIHFDVNIDTEDLQIVCFTHAPPPKFECSPENVWCDNVKLYILHGTSTKPVIETLSEAEMAVDSPYSLSCRVETSIKNSTVFWVLRFRFSTVVAYSGSQRYKRLLKVTDTRSETGISSVLRITRVRKAMSGMDILCYSYDYLKYGPEVCEQEPSLCAGTDRFNVSVEVKPFCIYAWINDMKEFCAFTVTFTLLFSTFVIVFIYSIVKNSHSDAHSTESVNRMRSEDMELNKSMTLRAISLAQMNISQTQVLP